MNASPWKKCLTLVAAASFLLVASSVFAGEKLKVFILAGQSNMVGYARAHTIATLYASDNARDKRLLKLVFGDDGKLSKKTLDEQLALGNRDGGPDLIVTRNPAYAPEVGPRPFPRAASRMSRNAPTPSPAPAFGEHTREVLLEVGYAEAAIDRLVNEGVVRLPHDD